MAKIPPQIIAAAVVAVLVVAFVVVESSGGHSGSLPVSVSASARVFASSAQGTTTSISSSSSAASSTTTSTAVNSTAPEGLQLTLVLNSTSIKSHGNLTAEIELTNTLSRSLSVSVPPPSHAVQGWNAEDFVCSDNPSAFLVDYALFQGHFTGANFSEAGSPLSLGPPFFPPCPSNGNPTSSATFLADSDQAMVPYTNVTAALVPTTGYCTLPQPGEVNCGKGAGLVGYWNDTISANDDLNFTSPAFTYFPPGEYTIVATDPWNQYLYATFVVLPNS